jgi:cytochrome c oxidase cbb3-type subunit 2
MTNFRTFILGLAAAFGLPWLCLIVLPAMKYQQLKPVAYDKEKDGVEGFFPPAPVNGQGQLVYVREGCNQCHTQMIRPSQLGLDGWYKGWGQDQEARPVPPVRTCCVTTSAKNTPCLVSSVSALTSRTSAGAPRSRA